MERKKTRREGRDAVNGDLRRLQVLMATGMEWVAQQKQPLGWEKSVEAQGKLLEHRGGTVRKREETVFIIHKSLVML